MSEIIEIDGAFGEGGGQILRTSLSLSCLLKKPLRIFNIRKGRKKPGLMPQHLTSVRIMQLISAAVVRGDEIGSTELYFEPREIKTGEFFYDIGTAGSTMLVLQTVLPPLIFSEKKSLVVLRGGTHVPMSPCYDYIKRIFCKFLEKVGITLNLSLEQYGFYPRGGGLIRAETEPAKEIKPLNILEPGRLLKIEGISGVANLPLSIAERQKDSLLKNASNLSIKMQIKSLAVRSPGPGTFLFIEAFYENSVAGFSSLGEKGKKAESVGEEAWKQFLRHLKTGCALDPHISDQIVLYLSLIDKLSEFSTSEITSHLLTNLWVLKQFLQIHYSVEGAEGQPGIVRLKGEKEWRST
ncbi:MAG: RNA 3'-terminal phosphate cyclase [Thermodesulfovibrionales bacterium]|nr:RNA 3'-terminal phosphate cyclase [Thermodesulfovibrionales bacterium]